VVRILVSDQVSKKINRAGNSNTYYLSAHAKGQLLSGTFTPTSEAKALSKAPHFKAASTPVLIRFSNSTGIPNIPDTDNNSKPHGIAIRFNLPEKDGKRVHTDVTGISTPLFPVRSGEDFGAFLRAVGTSPPGTASPTPVEQFIGSHPETLKFIQTPKPFPVSLATEKYFGLNAFKFISEDGKETFIRYQILPDLGYQTITDEAAAAKGDNYLFEEIGERVKASPFSFKLVAQIGEPNDVTDDVIEQWPEDRKTVVLGTVKLDTLIEDNEKVQKTTIFDPIPRIDGIEPSADPMLEFRAALYLISGRERRAA
jgi:catalase